MTFVCVLDMDETLGFFDNNIFHVRPNLNFLLQFLYLNNIKIILWSLGDDSYVERICNGFLPKIAKHADIIFARKECYVSDQKYNYYKASAHIRNLYREQIILIGVDDKVRQNMDDMYDLRIYVKPYQQINNNDIELVKVIETITSFWIENKCPDW